MTDYNKTGNPTQAARGISKQIRDEFALIETAVNSKANINSPTLTGVPRAPTASPGSSGTQIATLDYANALAFSSSLPSQTGNANKFITTNGTNASWDYINLFRSVRTSNTQLTTTDQSNFIDIASGTFTQTFDPCATLGNGWFCYIRNNGSGDITLDPDGAEQIGGQTTRTMYPGEALLVICDGVGLRIVILGAFIRGFASSGTFNTPSGYRSFSGLLWGGGGAGVKSGGATEARGGSGGACHPFTIPASSFGATETITIGAGGTGSGGTGGNSTLGSLVTAYGGGDGGGGLLSAGSGGFGGEPDAESSTTYHVYGGGDQGTSGVNGEDSYFGGAGGGGASLGSATAGGSSVYGGAGGGSVGNAGVTTAAGTSVFGGNGGAASDTGSGANGSLPGGGGGATRTGASSGQGGAGRLIIWGVV